MRSTITIIPNQPNWFVQIGYEPISITTQLKSHRKTLCASRSQSTLSESQNLGGGGKPVRGGQEQSKTNSGRALCHEIARQIRYVVSQYPKNWKCRWRWSICWPCVRHICEVFLEEASRESQEDQSQVDSSGSFFGCSRSLWCCQTARPSNRFQCLD